MDPNINKLLESIPEKPPRSKLQAHADLISALRRKRLTYREIAQFFREHLAITVAPSTIHDFVRVRRQRRSVSINEERTGDEPESVLEPRATGIPAQEDAVQRKINALKQRTPTNEPQPLFTYEADEPLKLRRKPVSDKVD